MSIEVRADCNECGSQIEADGYEDVYCATCYEEKEYGALDMYGVDSKGTADDLAAALDGIMNASGDNDIDNVEETIIRLKSDPVHVMMDEISLMMQNIEENTKRYVKDWIETAKKEQEVCEDEKVKADASEVQCEEHQDGEGTVSQPDTSEGVSEGSAV